MLALKEDWVDENNNKPKEVDGAKPSEGVQFTYAPAIEAATSMANDIPEIYENTITKWLSSYYRSQEVFRS